VRPVTLGRAPTDQLAIYLFKTMSPTDEDFTVGSEAQDILDIFADASQDDGINRDAEKDTALQAIAYVLSKNFAAAEAGSDDGTFSIGIKVTFDRNEIPTSIKATSRSSQIYKADIEISCPND